MKKIIIMISLTSLLLMGTVAYSQEPSPPVTQGQVQPREFKSEPSAKSNIKSNNNNYTSPNTTPVINNKNDTARSNAAAQKGYKENNKGQDGTGNNDPITTYTLWLMIFTGALVICNILLWIFTMIAANAAKKSTELARQEFIATHRPKLRVHSIFLVHDSIPEVSVNSKPWEIKFSIDNIGESPATIKECKLAFKKLEEPLPTIPPIGGECPIINKTFLESGEYTMGSISQFDKKTISTVLFYKTALDGGSQGRNANDLYFFGYIDYLDNIGNTRRIAFCRRYDIKTERFTAIHDEDYEYSY